MYNCPDNTINNIKIWYVHFIMQLSVTAAINNTFDKLVWLNKPVTIYFCLLISAWISVKFPSTQCTHTVHKFIGVRKEVNDHQVDFEMKNQFPRPLCALQQHR